MSELPDNTVTAALTFKAPQNVGWSVQSSDQTWTGYELTGLVDCLAQEGNNGPVALSISLNFELAGIDGTVRRSCNIPKEWLEDYRKYMMDIDKFARDMSVVPI